MSNLGSISDQTLAGVVTTATHGSGLHFGVLSTHVLALTLMLADGTKVTCSSAEHWELYKASLCGLGATGLILSITMQVEPAYRLKEVQNTISFDTLLGEFDELIGAAEHVRFWWFPQNGLVRTSYANRTIEVCHLNLASRPACIDRCRFRIRSQLGVGSGIGSLVIMSFSSCSSSAASSSSSTHGQQFLQSG